MDDLLNFLLAMAVLIVPLLLAWYVCARQLARGASNPHKPRKP